MKRAFYGFAIFIFISFMVVGCILNYLAHSSIHKATEAKVGRDLEILATTTQGALAQNDYERVEEQVFLWGELEPHIVSFEVVLDGDIEIIKYAREIHPSHILSLDKTISLPSGRIINFCIKYDLSEDDKEAAVMTTIFLSMSSCISVVFIFLLWRILQRLAFIPLNREITERKRVEKALLESELYFRDFFDNALIGFHIFDSNQTIKAINDSELEMIGYSRDEIVGKKTWTDLIVPDQKELFKKHWHEITTTGKVTNFEYKLIHKQGHLVDIILNASARFDADGKLINTRGSVLNITERKQDQEKIQNLARFPSENPSPVLRIAKDGMILYSNKAGKLLLDTWGSDIGKKAPDKLQNIITKAFQFEEVEEVEEIVKDRVFSFTIASIKNAGYANLYANDITERKRTEEKLYNFQKAVNSSSDAIGMSTPEGKHYYQNQAFTELFGMHVEETNGISGPPSTIYADEQVGREVFETVMRGDSWTGEIVMTCKDSLKLNVHLRAYSIKNEEGEIIGLVGVHTDITKRKQAEKALQAEQIFTNAIIQSMPGLFYIFEKNSIRFARRNDNWSKVTGYSEDELNTMKLVDFFEEGANRDLCVARVQGVYDIGSSSMENFLITKSGEPIPYFFTGEKLVVKDNTYLVGLALDITDRKVAEAKLIESETRFREMFQCMSNGVAVYEAVDCGRDFIFKDLNLAAERLEKIKKEDVVGEKITEVFTGIEEFGLLDIFRRVLETGNPEFFPVSFYKDGRISGWRENYVYRTPSGEIFAIYDDVTERKKAEEEILIKGEQLKTSNQQLLSSEQQLKARNQQLKDSEQELRANERQREKLIKTLEFKNKELQDIVYTASHDLRSPLVNIEGFSGELESDCDHLIELLIEQATGQGKREQIELIIKENIPESLRFISSGAKKMTSLLDGLMQISRIGTVEIHSESLEMDKVAREILASMEHQIKKNNILVTVDSLPCCKGDLHMLDHVFTNLISNAIKYRDPVKESEIRISGSVEDGMSIYCVQDNGIGIAPDHQKKIFEIFHRLNPLDPVSGEGLGLTIVTRVMDRLGGKIWVESEPGKGSKFFVALPKN